MAEIIVRWSDQTAQLMRKSLREIPLVSGWPTLRAIRRGWSLAAGIDLASWRYGRLRIRRKHRIIHCQQPRYGC